MTFDPDAVARHYDELDRFYREIWGTHVHHGLFAGFSTPKDTAVTDLIDHVVMPLQLKVGQRVCDVGCGYGATLRHLAAKYGLRGSGITLSRCQHEIATTPPLPAGVNFECGDWLTNKFPTDSFDGAIAIESSEHMADFDTFLNQAWRVLRPGGRLAIAAWLRRPGISHTLDRALNDPIEREGRLAQMLHTDAFISRVARRFRVISFEDVTRHVRQTWIHCAWQVLAGVLTKKDYRDFLFRTHKQDRVFALTVLRIAIAYYFGTMSYGILIAEKS